LKVVSCRTKDRGRGFERETNQLQDAVSYMNKNQHWEDNDSPHILEAPSLLLLISEDWGRLTDNVVFIGGQRLFARKAALASPKARLARRSLTGHRRWLARISRLAVKIFPAEVVCRSNQTQVAITKKLY